MKFRLGVLVNPYAGIGGSVALKGSDGEAIRDEALSRGAQQLAPVKMRHALEAIKSDQIELFTWGGAMGEESIKDLKLECLVLGSPQHWPTSAEDTLIAARAMVDEGVDLILFAGGDGTARNIYEAIGQQVPVLGVPAGVKIHSGVYTLTPSLAGSLITDLIEGRLVRMEQAEVRDIDESEFRQGRVRAKYYGELLVPAEHQYVQSVKEGGKEVEELVVADIAADFVEQMDPELLYVMGSGTTVAAIMDELGLENTLLGTDLIKDGEVVASDCSAQQLLELVGDAPFKIVITPIGGQGHLLGRGNQQLSPQLIQKVGLPGLYVVATRSKIVGLNGRPLIIDSGDPELDRKLTGVVAVHTGYRDAVIYRVGI